MKRALILLTSLAIVLPGPAAAAAAAPTVEAAHQERVDRREQRRRGGQQGRSEEVERTTRTVNIGANGEIDITNISGDMTVTRGGGSAVTIEIVKTARADTSEDAKALLALVSVDVVERGTRAEAKVRYPNEEELRRRNRRNINVDVAFNITVPQQTRVVLHSISGNFDVRDVSGVLSLDTISGNIRLANSGRSASAKTISGNVELADTSVEGMLTAATISGSLRFKGVTARGLELSTVSGTIVLQDVASDRIEGQAISGDVEFSGDFEANGRYEFTSHSGSVKLAIGGKTGFQIDATSFSGGIRSDLPLTMEGNRRGGRALHGRHGNGSATLDVTSFSGSIVITKR
jgi:DUF4097 and DUF4098 domain-containing protein YvlB